MTSVEEDIGCALSWLNRMLDVVHGRAADDGDLNDPVEILSKLHETNRLRTQLERIGVTVPPIVEVETDPVGNMIAWRAFLAEIVTVH